jgi:CDP-glucose 4,6-dehydratase
MFADAFRDKHVWISGHTGFKGAWLTCWLLNLQAKVHGFSLEPPTIPSLFSQLGLEKEIDHDIADVRDSAALTRSIERVKPDYVFHLAAQPLVRDSYSAPVETYATNVMGTVHVLEALRHLETPCTAIFITTDKCYENREWHYAYREEDPLGGHDPYSSSKAATEIAILSYRRSFFQNHPVKIASVRAGNVIGGGDWARDRIVPDCIRALQQKQPIEIRNKVATRPWQHVLDPLSGYLWLAARMSNANGNGAGPLCSAFNFGPTPEANRAVHELVEEILKHWPGEWIDKSNPHAVHEAMFLQLAIDKARSLLDWMPAWTFSEAVANTVIWYRESQHASTSDLRALTNQQLKEYCGRAKHLGLPWSLA